jgi:hypothetical protein
MPLGFAVEHGTRCAGLGVDAVEVAPHGNSESAHQKRQRVLRELAYSVIV